MLEHLLPEIPALATLDIETLETLTILFEALENAAMSVANQPRCREGNAGRFADKIWQRLGGVHDAIIDELRKRKPTNPNDADVRARVILRQMAEGYRFREIAAFAMKAERATEGRFAA